MAIDIDAVVINIYMADEPFVNPQVAPLGVVYNSIQAGRWFACKWVIMLSPPEMFAIALKPVVISKQVAKKIVVVRQ